MILRLGTLLVLRSGRRGWVRLTLLTLGTAIGVWCLLVTLAFPQVIKARQGRAEDRIPVTERGDRTTAKYHFVTERVGADPLPILFISGSPRSLPPGVERLPARGKAVVSPALRTALNEDQGLREIFPYRVEGLIGDRGLTGPNEWFAYVGANPGDLPARSQRLSGFGADLNPEVDVSGGDLTFINISLLGIVGVPLSAYFLISARLSAASRDRRLAALRLIGMSSRLAQRVNAFESFLAAVVGSLIGLLIYAGTHSHLASFGIGGVPWFSQDSAPRLGMLFVALCLVPLMAAIVSVVGSRRAVRDALAVRRDAAASRPRLWRLIPLLLGAGVLLAIVVVGEIRPEGGGVGDRGPLLLMVGISTTAAGLLLAFEFVPVSMGRLAASKLDRVALLLGVRRLEFEPAGAVRVVAGLVVVVFAMGFANGIQRDAQAAALPRGDTQLYELTGGELRGVAVERLAGIEGVTGVAIEAFSNPVGERQGPEGNELYLNLIWADCSDLRALTGSDIEGCLEGEAFSVEPDVNSLINLPPPGTRFTVPMGRKAQPSLSLRVPSQTVRLPRQAVVALGYPSLILTPESLPKGKIPSTAQVLLSSPADDGTLHDVTLGLASAAPNASVIFANSNFDERRRSELTQSILHVSIGLGILIGLAAFLVASIDRIVERKQNLVSLAVVGVPMGIQRLAQVIQTLLPMLVGVVFALVAGKLAEHATILVGGVASGWSWSSTMFPLVVGLIASVLVACVTAMAMTRSIDVSLIRRD